MDHPGSCVKSSHLGEMRGGVQGTHAGRRQCGEHAQEETLEGFGKITATPKHFRQICGLTHKASVDNLFLFKWFQICIALVELNFKPTHADIIF